MIITGDDGDEIVQLKKYLATEFEIKKTGRFEVFPWH